MEIKDSGFYSIKETAKIVKKPTRTLQRIAKNNNYRKIDGRYLFTGAQIKKILIKTSEVPPTSRQTSNFTPRVFGFSDSGIKVAEAKNQIDLQVQSLEVEVEKLKVENTKLKEKPTNEFLQIIKEIDNDNYVLSVMNAVKEEKHLEDFTDEEYIQFRYRLKEANALEIRIAEYKAEIGRMEEYVLDYRNNIEYLKKSLDRRAEETAIILKSIEQRTFIEAKDKGLDN